MFSTPQVNIYSRDVETSLDFWSALGFTETFRTPAEGTPDHVELTLQGLRIGIGSAEAGINEHGLDLHLDERGRGMEIVLWTDDVDAAHALATGRGARSLQEPRDFRAQRVAYVLDPDDNPVEFVAHRDGA